MTKKEDCHLPSRTPQFLSRETCAAEFEVSLSTWDDWVKSGVVPKPYMLGRNGLTPRWSWDDIREYLNERGKTPSGEAPRSPFVNPGAFRAVAREKGETRRKTENNRRQSA